MTVTSRPFPPCPRCGSRDAVEIIYGLPDLELGVAAERGEVVLGGCIIGDASSDYQCRGCEAPLPWVRDEEADAETGASAVDAALMAFERCRQGAGPGRLNRPEAAKQERVPRSVVRYAQRRPRSPFADIDRALRETCPAPRHGGRPGVGPHRGRPARYPAH